MTQIATRPASINAIMRSRAFKRGVDDVRATRPPDYDSFDDIDACWNYERGRAWGISAPPDMPVTIGRRINPAAIRIFDRSVI